jgi:hypothetical protein
MPRRLRALRLCGGVVLTAVQAAPAPGDLPVRRSLGASAFSPKVVLALILVSVFSFSALSVLFAYEPDLRKGSDGRAHALSKSAMQAPS